MTATLVPGPAEAARERYLDAWRAFAGNGAASAAPWVRELRERGIARFAERGFPSPHEEAWRFTNVAPLLEAPFRLGGQGGAAAVGESDLAALLLPGADRPRLVFVDGRFCAALSRVAGVPAGVTFGPLADALTAGGGPARAALEGSTVDARGAFGALNTAFLTDGAFVHVPAGVEVAEPLQVLHLVTPASHGVVAHPRTLLVLERLARAALIETYAGADGVRCWTNAATELVVGDGARADLYRVQREGDAAFHTAATHSRQGRDSVVQVHPVALGASLARHDIVTVLDGEGARCILNGLYLLGGAQHVDHHTTIDHAQPHAESHEYFNGVLDGHARSVFTGRIIVRPGAQRTDSKQTNNNLLLSEDARADSQPQLEIYADDVKCTHGATLGPIDQRALFYLESRGLGPAEARALLTYGFGAEILERMDVPELRAQLDAIVRRRLLAATARAGAA